MTRLTRLTSPSLRLAAGTLVLALPLAAAAGCGAQKKLTVRQEFSAAEAHLRDAKAVSFTLHLDDSKGNLAKLAKKDDAPDALAKAFIGGSITYVADAKGDAALRTSACTQSFDMTKAFTKANFSFLVSSDKAPLGELRMVDGTLYGHVALPEIKRLAEAGGVDDFDSTLDDAVSSMPPALATALSDVRAGKWLKLPLAKYLAQMQKMAASVAPDLASGKQYDICGLGKKLYAGVKPFVKVTDANDSSDVRVLDVKVQAKKAVQAAFDTLKAQKDLPFASLFTFLPTTEITSGMSDGEAHGTITLKKSHLTKFTVDVDSLRTLAKDPGTDSVAGLQVVVDVDDDAAQLSAPTDVSTVDLGALLDQLFSGMLGAEGGFTEG